MSGYWAVCKEPGSSPPAPAGGTDLRNLRVGFTGQPNAPSSGTWYPRFGPVDAWFGDPNVITITPAPDATSSDILTCSKDIFTIRIYLNIQSANFGGNPRAFLSLFLDGNGVQGTAVSPAPGSNNNRQQIIMEYGGIVAGVEHTLAMSWNGNTPLTVNLGLSYMVITYLENSIPAAEVETTPFTLTPADFDP